jgi:threonine synthase
MALGRATAHAAKFPDVIRQALSVDGKLPVTKYRKGSA